MLASREFVCIRPQTYENAAEAEILSWVFADRDGTLRNTSFGILSSDGKRKLSRSGRSPEMVFGDTAGFREALERIAREQGTEDRKELRALPALADLRLALNVAAADLRPLVVLFGRSAKETEGLRERLEPLAWSEDFVGRFAFVTVAEKEGLAGFEDLGLEPGLSVVEPEAFGRGGKVLVHLSPSAAKDAIQEGLTKALAAFAPRAKDVRAHLRQGETEDIDWEPELPVTDPQARR